MVTKTRELAQERAKHQGGAEQGTSAEREDQVDESFAKPEQNDAFADLQAMIARLDLKIDNLQQQLKDDAITNGAKVQRLEREVAAAAQKTTSLAGKVEQLEQLASTLSASGFGSGLGSKDNVAAAACQKAAGAMEETILAKARGRLTALGATATGAAVGGGVAIKAVAVGVVAKVWGLPTATAFFAGWMTSLAAIGLVMSVAVIITAGGLAVVIRECINAKPTVVKETKTTTTVCDT